MHKNKWATNSAVISKVPWFGLVLSDVVGGFLLFGRVRVGAREEESRLNEIPMTSGPDMKSIAIVLPGFPRYPGGGHKIAYQYANALSGMGHKVFVLHLRPSKIKDASVRRIRRWLLAAAYWAGRRMRPRWFQLSPSVYVRNYYKQEDRFVPSVDVVIATSVSTAEFVANVVTARNIDGIYLIQGYETFSANADLVERTWLLPLRRVVVSKWLLRTSQRLGVEASLVPNGLDLEEFRPGPPIDQRPLEVLGLYSEAPVKRADVLVDTMLRLNSEFSNLRLVCFGVGARPATLPREIEYVQNPSKCDLSALYQQARVYICSSDFEGYGLPAAEALACGAAVVSTRNGGVEDIAASGVLFADKGDSEGLAEVTALLLKDPTMCQVLAEEGQKAIRSYAVQDAASAFERVILQHQIS